MITPINMCCGGMSISKTIPAEFNNSISYLEILMELCGKTNEIINALNGELTEEMTKYIEEHFNNIMMNAVYEPATETLVLSLEEN